jgi:hypothetical protein
MTRRSRRVLGALALASVVALSGCVRGCTSSRPPIHINPSMDDQPKVLAQTASKFFYDGASMRQPVPGTIPIGGLKEDAAFFTGKGEDSSSRRSPGPLMTRSSSADASGTGSIASLATTLEGTVRGSCSSEATFPPPPSTRTRS